ncbi:single-stranded nucleic acid binding R3H domain protein [Rippkaea orientalis PCC 8801]|uniref:Single-stranded nucleic acid binding R3H domain protein n=1 Tax=Rippkaea orientalis (strain PCC 8801 / RF-1) TaxID=41431 RepID=B7K5U2_RIPO1|nr:R3H domain-containing nucleic acid-binding protein [Rippkaea orientalis]ACK67995.1 single-stranded nucleic acid binding R3H domain protein [Rippkaea orientalis PCC 8801]
MEQPVHPGKAWLETLLKLMGFPAQVTVEEKNHESPESAECWLTIDDTQLTPEQIEMILGNHGEGIDAIQYLANTLINLSVEPEQQGGFMVELQGYRLQRQQELNDWVQQVAQQVRQTGQEVEMTSLSSAERRQVHTMLKDAEDLETESRGQEPDRRLVVRLR